MPQWIAFGFWPNRCIWLFSPEAAQPKRETHSGWQCESIYSRVQGGDQLSGRYLPSMGAPCPRHWGQLVSPGASHRAPEHELFVFGPLQHQTKSANPTETCLWTHHTQETKPFWSLVTGKWQTCGFCFFFSHISPTPACFPREAVLFFGWIWPLLGTVQMYSFLQTLTISTSLLDLCHLFSNLHWG